MSKWAQRGFTIVELLIVIVVIGILAAIVIVSYNGTQDKAQNAKIANDIAQLKKAIISARASSNQTLGDITGAKAAGNYSGAACASKPSGTDFATLSQSDSCWTTYKNALNAIYTAGGVDVRQLVDPWGRPYWIWEKEGDVAGVGNCAQDQLYTLARPFTQWGGTLRTSIENSLSGC